MGNFANTMFSVLLGWVQRTAAWLWELIGSDGADGLLGWVLDNWLGLAILLCLAGVAIDLVVYIVRWQPYRVWRSFLHRHDEEPEAEPLPVAEERLQWVYANGETALEPEVPEEVLADELPPQPAPRVIPARRRRTEANADAYAQQGYHQPYYPPQWSAEDHPSNGGTQG